MAGRSRTLLIAVAGALVLAVAGFAAFKALPRRNAPAAATQAARTLTFTDDVGRTVTLKLPVKRTVVFNRYTTEFIRAVAGMDVVVGDDIDPVKFHAYWPTVTKAMQVGTTQTNPNYEAIVALKPDLVLFPRNGAYQEAEKALAPFGIPVAVITAWDVLKHEENVDLIGRIYEQPEKAARLNAFYRQYRDLLAERLKGVKQKRVYLEEVGEYKTLLKGSGWHDMVETGGGINVFGNIDILNQPSARGSVQGFEVDPEEILARKPDVIIKLQPAQYEPQPRAFSEKVLNAVAARPGFVALPAVKSGEVYHMSYHLAGGCSKIIGALQIAKWLYPERFQDVDPEAVMKVWLEEFQHVPASRDYWISLAQLRK